MSDTKDTQTTSRRGFLAGGALLGAGLIVAEKDALAAGTGKQGNALLNSSRPDAPYELVKPENMIHTVCLQCNTGCGIRCKLQNGVITKVDGNPYNPWTLVPHLDYEIPLDAAAAVDGAICPKGQAGLQTAYDPYRIRKVLKRAGKRGENKWQTIPFEQAVKEICDGGKLFAHISGEENREVEGLKRIVALTDAKVAKAMAEDVKHIWKEKDKEKKKQLVEEFKKKHADNLGKLIDPNHPDFGPKNNQIVCAFGRLKGGRSDLYKRFAAALGTTNLHGHTTVCQGSLYFTCKAISEQYQEGKFGGGNKFYWQTDLENSRFVLFVGANLFDANYGPPNRSVRLTGNLVSGRTKIAVVDPRFSKLASKAWKWLPLKPGTDSALALAIIRWMIDHKRYDEKFLRCANKAAAKKAGESTWCNATWLVEIKDGKPGKLIRAADHGIAQAETRKTKDGKEYQEKFIVAMVDGKAVALDPNDAEKPVTGDLLVDAQLSDGTKVKSGLQVVYESAKEHTVKEWAEIAGVDEATVIEVARELTSHGKQGSVDCHRGPAQHTNGFYNVLSWMTINMLLGNIDAKGGMIKATAFDTSGKKGKLFELGKHSGKISPFGISSIRHGVKYEDTTVFSGYPAKRNWWPLSSDVYEEIIPSIGDQYPYPVKALFMYKGAPTYSLPAGHTNIKILCDMEKVPLFVANDILIGTTSMYADYIFPDLSHLERWEFQGSHPNIPTKVQPVRQPAMAPITEEVKVFGQTVPICFESMMMAIGEYMKLTGFGKDAFGQGLDFTHPDDFYLRGVANLAFGESPDGSKQVPDASERELKIFREARKHLPKSMYDEERWKRIVGEKIWSKVVYVLNRGGRFENHSKAYKGNWLAYPYGAYLNLYQEKTASTKHAGTGKPNPGYATYLPIRDFHGKEPVDLRKGYDLHMITNRSIVHTKSRTIADPWLSPLMPENGLIMNPRDISRLGFKPGQKVKVVSATNPEGEWDLGAGNKKLMVGKIIATETIRPGIVSFVLGFGHWATGAADVIIDGIKIKGEARRATGIHANAAMWVDPALKNTCMIDPVGGSVSFYDTFVRLVPVS
ncbi:MAG: molybdopterin-dependent oxidoreductase [Thermodesulfobacteriota bacterium]